VGDIVVNVANDANCDNGLFCDGAEICHAFFDCGPGALPADDGVFCTDDSCDEGGQSVDHTPNAARCETGDRCTVAGCDALTGCFQTEIPGCVPVPALSGSGRVLLMAMLALSARALLRCRRPRENP
jgi:hypothetical protein